MRFLVREREGRRSSRLVEVDSRVRRRAARGGARGGGGRGSREDVVAGHVLVHRGRGRRGRRRICVVRARVRAEARHGQGRAVRRRAHCRLSGCRTPRQWRRVV